ncbi:MAG: hypothetical protein JNN05_01170 [Candidatus Omnitrophica bacterium]|nr:hypothetical protein [Candidatus Omnitrophota bacterium]
MILRILSVTLLLNFLLIAGPAIAATDWCASANMKGAWKIDETSGTIQDCTSNNNDGTNNAGSLNVSGKFGTAIDYNQNNNEYLDFGSPTAFDNVTQKTIGAWTYIDTDGDNSSARCNAGVIFQKTEWGFCIEPTDKMRYFHRWNGGQTSWDTTNADVTYAAWTHWAVKYDRSSSSNDPTIYKDGVAKSTNNPTPCCSGANDDSGSSLLMANIFDVDEWDGKFDEAFFYSGMMTSTDINEIKDSGLDGLQGTSDVYSGRGIGRGIGRGVGR